MRDAPATSSPTSATETPTTQAVIGSGAGFGLLLGGILVDALNWRWLLLANVPVGGLILLPARRFLPGRPGPRHGPAGSTSPARRSLCYRSSC